MQGEQCPALWNPHKAALGRCPGSSLHGSSGPRAAAPNHVADPAVRLPGSARGTRLCRRDLSSFHVVSQSGQTNPAERGYKLGIVSPSCWEVLTVYKGEKLINPWVSFVFTSLCGQLWKGNDCKQPISKTALVKRPRGKVMSNCYLSQGFPPRFKRQEQWNEALRCTYPAKHETE